MKSGGGAVAAIPLRGELRLIQRALMPGSVRQGKLVLGVASADSWFWHAATIDLETGEVTTDYRQPVGLSLCDLALRRRTDRIRLRAQYLAVALHSGFAVSRLAQRVAATRFDSNRQRALLLARGGDTGINWRPASG